MRKKHKWKYRINIKKKILVLVILGVFLFVGLGYAIIESSLGIGGTLSVSKYDKTLYGALKKDVSTGYAVKYSGTHQDSMDSTKSTEDIYYYYADNSIKANDILEKNNVVFANSCWQMYRTTDTGGVRMIYNGKPIITDNNGVLSYDCGSTRNYYDMGGIKTTLSLSGTYKYAKNYTVSTSGTTTTFTLVDDPDDPDDYKSITINSGNAEANILDIATNYPYTCKNSSGTCTNNAFYKVDSYDSGTTANVYISTEVDNIGHSNYNVSNNSAAYFGYMYGEEYPITKQFLKEEVIFRNHLYILDSGSIKNTHYYGTSISYDTPGAQDMYSLNGTDLIGNVSNYSDLVGNYTFNRETNTFTAGWVRYITAVDGSTMYYKELSGGDTDVSIRFADSVSPNGDGTYSLVNPTSPINLTNWYTDYASYRQKYTCGNSSTTCASPRYIIDSTKTRYTYVSENITIAKSRNNLNLDDYVTIDKKAWYDGYNTTYKDYVYTCGNADTVCSETNLSYILKKNESDYWLLPNYYYGKSVKYEDNKFKLQDTEGLETAISTNLNTLATHHYTCLEKGKKECDTVAYIYYNEGTSNIGVRYITLNDPNVLTVSDALEDMLTINTKSSTIKTNIDTWYSNNIENTSFESKIDDTVYCSDRSIGQLGGWNDNGGLTTDLLQFNEYKSSLTTNLSCSSVKDKLSVTNNDAKLNYPVALISAPEANMLSYSTGRTIRNSKAKYWTLTPAYFSEDTARSFHITGDGSLGGSADTVNTANAVRPVISLIKGTSYTKGIGSTTNPYIVDMN